MATHDKQPTRGRDLAKFSLASVDIKLLRLLAIVVVVFVGMSIAKPNVFPTPSNFQSMSVQFPEIGILAIAIMLTMLTGGIDLSVVNIANLSGILAALTLAQLVPADAGASQAAAGIAAGIVVSLGVGLLCGLVNGLLVAGVGITPILATLGTMTLFGGLGIAITKGTAVFAVPAFLFIGGGSVMGLPIPLLIFAVLALIFTIVLNHTTFGFRVYMLGTNPIAAHYSGINTRRVLITTYVLSGLLGAIAGIIFLARNNSAKADYASSYVLQAILVAILGGVNPAGGFGKISGLILAILSLQFLSTGLNMLLVQYSGSNFFKEFAWGALLLLVMVFDYVPWFKSSRTFAPVPETESPQGKEAV